MKIVYFTHSLISCWNHGNAHFLRGVMRSLIAGGHDVTVCEPAQSWSRDNLIQERAEAPAEFAQTFPMLAACTRILPDGADIDAVLDHADVVIVHEWNEPALVASVGAARLRGGRFVLLFHDTHHRMVSEPDAMARYDLAGYDAVLAFGATLSEAYRRHGWGERVFTWHEAADDRVVPSSRRAERSATAPSGSATGETASAARNCVITCWFPSRGSAFRSTSMACAILRKRGRNWRSGVRAITAGPRMRGQPEIFARHRFTLHVPRRFYVTQSARHPDDPRLRSAGLRNSSALGAMGTMRSPSFSPG